MRASSLALALLLLLPAAPTLALDAGLELAATPSPVEVRATPVPAAERLAPPPGPLLPVPNLPLWVDEAGDTMGGDLAFAPGAGVAFPAGRLSAEARLDFEGRAVCLAGLVVAGCPQGDITAVLAGPGLLGGAAAGDATLAVDTAAIQARVTGTCVDGIAAIAGDGTVVCEAPEAVYTAGPGLAIQDFEFRIADEGVATPMLADGAVTMAKLAPAAVTSGKLADGAVGTPHLADGAVTADKLGEACLEGQVLLRGPGGWGCADVLPNLHVRVKGRGDGAVRSDDGSIDCGAVCSAVLPRGAVVTLTATPDAASAFAGWSGACTGTGACVVLTDVIRNVTATFQSATHGLTVTTSGGGIIVSDPLGIYCGAACRASFGAGTTVILTASPEPAATFAGWSGACSGTGVCVLTLDEVRNVTATFARADQAMTVSRTGTGSGVVTSSPAGIDCGSTCAAAFTAGTTVTLTATPDSTSAFAGWSGACTGTGSCTVTLDAAASATATFVRQTFALTVTRTGSGTVTSNPLAIFCGATCAASFEAGATVTLTASPDAAATFAGWSGACTGSGVCTLSMTSAKSVAATFVKATRTLTVAKAGTGAGTVESSPAGISCGSTCAATYDLGTVVALTATPDSTSTFAGWSGACTGTGACVVSLAESASVTATFTKQSLALTVSRTGTGSGVVTSSPAGIDCGSTCAAAFTAGTTVTLTATPDSTSTFAGWSGACTGTGSCAVTMDAAKALTATFVRQSFALTVTRTGGGTVTSSPAGIYCGAACSTTFGAGTTVTLTASPDATASFAGWSGACTGTGVCTVTMTSAKSVSARFTAGLTVTKTGTGGGTVTSSPAGLNCGSTCAGTFDAGSLVTLQATPDAASTFAGWSGACSGTGGCAVSVHAATSVTATFVRTTHTLSVARAGSGGGVVASSPGGIDCGTICSGAFDAGMTVTLTATPDSTSSFAGWSGACTGTGACVVTMDAAKSATATFSRVTHTLTVDRQGPGTVTTSPLAVYCGAACSGTFDAGTTVALTATPDAGASFAGWAGGCTGTGACVVTMVAAKSVTAKFGYGLDLAFQGSGQGVVSMTPGPVSCSAACAPTFSPGTVVTLTGTPAQGSTFLGWSGACAGTGPCTVTMDQARQVSAAFFLPG